MRKYYQAALLVTAIVSLISLLFYRHEYNKLRYVLEVFNYFGKPAEKNINVNCTTADQSTIKFDVSYEEPQSAWQRFDDNLYVYSAYNIQKKEVRAIAFGKLSDIQNWDCMVLFDNEIEPSSGSFQHITIDNGLERSNLSDMNGYVFVCRYNMDKLPVGVTFLQRSTKQWNNNPVLSVKTQPAILSDGDTAICVAPPMAKSMLPIDMISFLSFHKLIGFNNFIVYDFGIPNKFNNRLKQIARQYPHWELTYSTVPWNFPFSEVNYDVIRNIIEVDCLYRTYNKATYIVSLSWEEYIILKYHHLILNLISDFSKLKMIPDRYKLYTSTFCTQQADATNSSILLFRKTQFDASIKERRSIYIHKSHKILKDKNVYTKEIRSNLLMVNRYKLCDTTEINTESFTNDVSVLRFHEDMQSSPVFNTFYGEKDLKENKRINQVYDNSVERL